MNLTSNLGRDKCDVTAQDIDGEVFELCNFKPRMNWTVLLTGHFKFIFLNGADTFSTVNVVRHK